MMKLSWTPALVLALWLCAPGVTLADEPLDVSVERPPWPQPAPQSWMQRTWLPPRPARFFEASVAASAFPSTRTFELDVDVEAGPDLAFGVHGTLTHCSACNISSDGEDNVHDVGLAYAYVGYARPNYMVAGALLLTHGEGLESRAKRFGYGSMFLLRAGRVDGLRFELGAGLAVTETNHGGSGAFVLHNALDVPVFRSGDYAIELEARSDFAILDPFFWMPSLALHARTGPVVFGVRAHLMSEANSVMLFVGYHRE